MGSSDEAMNELRIDNKELKRHQWYIAVRSVNSRKVLIAVDKDALK